MWSDIQAEALSREGVPESGLQGRGAGWSQPRRNDRRCHGPVDVPPRMSGDRRQTGREASAGSGTSALRRQEEGKPTKETQMLGGVPGVRRRKRGGKERMLNCDKCHRPSQGTRGVSNGEALLGPERGRHQAWNRSRRRARVTSSANTRSIPSPPQMPTERLC